MGYLCSEKVYLDNLLIMKTRFHEFSMYMNRKKTEMMVLGNTTAKMNIQLRDAKLKHTWIADYQ